MNPQPRRDGVWLARTAVCLSLLGCDSQTVARPTDAPTPVASVSCLPRTGDVDDCTFALPAGRVRVTDSVYQRLRLFVSVDGEWRALPEFYGTRMWRNCYFPAGDGGKPRGDRVAIADLDDDGRKDIMTVAACEPAAGGPPDGLRPFGVATLYRQIAPGRYVTDSLRDSALTEALPDSCAQDDCDVLAVARRVLGTPPTPPTSPGA